MSETPRKDERPRSNNGIVETISAVFAIPVGVIGFVFILFVVAGVLGDIEKERQNRVKRNAEDSGE